MSKFDPKAAADRLVASALACEANIRRQGAEEFRARAVAQLGGFATRFHGKNKHERAAAFEDAANIIAALPVEPEKSP